jgi:citrate lyase subunit beta/citryl-CoA lyase
MIDRSFLFVPADSERKLEKARATHADALILDLEDAVAADRRGHARALAQEYLHSESGGRSSLWVRVNPVGSPEFEDDLDAVVASRPAGLVIPKPDSPDTLRSLDRELSQLEDRYGFLPRSIQLMPVASETPLAVATLMEYRDPPARLSALTWGAEDLAAAMGAISNRDAEGEFLFTYRMVRSMALLAAKLAGVAAIETLHADFRDLEGLERAARLARREGFSGMLAIHPDQVAVINAAFSPSTDEVDHARHVVAAFASGVGVAALDGKMLDQPHLKQARQILALDEKIRARK